MCRIEVCVVCRCEGAWEVGKEAGGGVAKAKGGVCKDASPETRMPGGVKGR